MKYGLLALITILLYLTSTVFEGLQFADKIKTVRWRSPFFNTLAIGMHGLLLYWLIDTALGQNLTFLNLLSLLIWVIAVLIVFIGLYKPLESLLILICPLAAISIALTLGFSSMNVIHAGENPKQLIHILLAVLTVSVFSLAGLQALLLALQEYQLRHKPGAWWWKKFPPLETMETLLFQMIGFGFVLLSVVIITSLSFFHTLLVQQIAQKTLFVVLAWFIFAGLVIGRCFLGWRGRKAIYGTFCGVTLLIISYLGSKLLLEWLF
jgi:ABC-type uncharacterized transport system permease subunit